MPARFIPSSRRSRWAAVLATPALVASGLAGVTAADAAPGDFHTGFAGGGRMALGNQFRVVAVDQFGDDRFTLVSIRPGGNDSLDIRRFHPNGIADISFAGDGDIQVGGQADWGAPAVALDRVRGYTYVSAYAANAGFSRVWRFTPAGAADPAWGGLGRVDFNGARFLDIALQPDGALVVANGASVYRLGPTGAVDGTFGNGGGVTLGTGQVDSLRTLADGTIVAAGRSGSTIDVFRLHKSGALDNDFGANGRATYRPTPPLGWAVAGIEPVTVGVQNDGGVVVASGAVERNTGNNNTRSPLIVTRFTKGGGQDSRFTTTRSYDVSISGKLTVQANDKVVVPVTNGGRATLWRLEGDGDLDPTFGTGGGWTDAQADSRPTATLVQRAGYIVVTGFAAGRTGLVWAFQGDRTPSCKGRFATAYGGATSDVLRGTDGDDVIVGGRGKDKIKADAGADRVCAGQGKDVVIGGSGKDVLTGEGDGDVLKGYDGRDKLVGGGGNDRLEGNKGRDKLKGGKGVDRLFGGPDRDKLKGGAGRDRLDGGPGRDKERQ
jgi:Ca2+-binding RTX toxin-like protein